MESSGRGGEVSEPGTSALLTKAAGSRRGPGPPPGVTASEVPELHPRHGTQRPAPQEDRAPPARRCGSRKRLALHEALCIRPASATTTRVFVVDFLKPLRGSAP
ncbi:hypothetical protein EYF80_064850 [Liparis tanakae]|uniref:Uncharacterized protein n=1 Tax=Liparis tanakae TaxID=230148 RepID=A0A4Z2E8M3_9TELE|nr:hypothetical protein EYF80_064850 [Liparis tanakae]